DPSYLFREYLETQLSSTLTNGKKYLVSFWTCRGDAAPQGVLATNKMGLMLSTSLVSQNDTSNLALTPDYQYPLVITDSANWERIAHPFTATGSEGYLVIGNFNDNSHTTVQTLGSTANGARAYYYIDDVSIDECSEVVNGDFETGTVPTGLSQIGNAPV